MKLVSPWRQLKKNRFQTAGFLVPFNPYLGLYLAKRFTRHSGKSLKTPHMIPTAQVFDYVHPVKTNKSINKRNHGSMCFILKTDFSSPTNVQVELVTPQSFPGLFNNLHVSL